MLIVVMWNLLQEFLKYDTWFFQSQNLHMRGASHIHGLKGSMVQGTCEAQEVTVIAASALVVVMNLAAPWSLPVLLLPNEKGWDLGKTAVGQGRSTFPVFHCLPTDSRGKSECTAGTSLVVCPFIFISYYGENSLDLAWNNLL